MGNSRYIRCIKPNKPKKPVLMEHLGTIEQLRCAGVVAAVTLSRSAFPNRLENDVVRFKFWQLWDKDKYPSKATRDMGAAEKLKCDCEALLECALAPLKEINPKTGKPFTIALVGKTRSYFKMGVLEFLESHRSSGLEEFAVAIQRIARGFITRNRINGSANDRKNGVYMVQRWWREMISKNRAAKEAEEERKRQEKEEAKRKQEQEEREWREKIDRETREAEESAKKEYRKYDNRLEELDGQLRDAESRYKERCEDLNDRLNQAKEEAEELKTKLEDELMFAAAEPAKQAAAQKTKLEKQEIDRLLTKGKQEVKEFER